MWAIWNTERRVTSTWHSRLVLTGSYDGDGDASTWSRSKDVFSCPEKQQQRLVSVYQHINESQRIIRESSSQPDQGNSRNFSAKFLAEEASRSTPSCVNINNRFYNENDIQSLVNIETTTGRNKWSQEVNTSLRLDVTTARQQPTPAIA